jgi:prolyl-tRNA synthetase
MVNVLAVPVVVGRKTKRERFAGAINTLTCEAMTRDGKALQMATSHELGQNFARAFGIEYMSADGARELAWTTSWGSSTRMVGGLVMVHGDDDGLRVPPVLAPIQVVVVAVTAEVVDAAHKIGDSLHGSGVRVIVDDRTDTPFGRRVIDWELKGVPLRVELGPRDLDANAATLARRLSGGKTQVGLGELAGEVPRLLAEEQQAMLDAARRERDARIAEASTVDDAAAAGAEGWAKIAWSTLGERGEAKLAADGVTVRCLQRPGGSVPESDTEPDLVAYVSRAY